MDISIPSISVSVAGKPLLQETDFTLSYGIRYGLVGSNGCGKSTLLREICQRNGDFAKIPKEMSILHVEQEIVGDDTTVLQSILNADPVMMSLLNEQEMLEKDENSDPERLGIVYQKLADCSADEAVSRAKTILRGLQFLIEDLQRRTREFSGGWRMRLALARSLFMVPDILILDEPTNHLDLHAVIWLEGYLQKWKKSLIVVSHDRDFLNHITERVIYIYNKKLYYYKADYDTCADNHQTHIDTMRTKAEQDTKKVKELSRQIAEQKQEQSQSGKKKGSSSSTATSKQKDARPERRGKSNNVKEKMKMKMEEIIKSTPKVLKYDYEVEFYFPDSEELGHLVELRDVSFGYPQNEQLQQQSQPLFKNVNLLIESDSKIALVGVNGSGKSTLIKLLMGKLLPTTGEVLINRKMRYGYFSQHFVDQLDMTETPVSYIKKSTNQNTDPVSSTSTHSYNLATIPSEQTNYSEAEIRRFLGRFGLTGKQQILDIASLSGGQKSRVIMTEIGLKYPHLLLLDEPTNHLDMESVDALCESLENFNGGILLISHDVRLITRVCDQVWVVNKEEKTVQKWDGDFESYRDFLTEELDDES